MAAGAVLEVDVLSPRDSSSWTREAGEDWSERFQGTAPFGRIGKALKPLVEMHGWPEVRAAWQGYFRQAEADYASAEKFAHTFGRWNGSAPPARKESAVERNRETLARFVSGEEGR